MLTKEFIRPLSPAFRYYPKTWQNPAEDANMRFALVKVLAQIEFDKNHHKAEKIKEAIESALARENIIYESSPTKEHYTNIDNINQRVNKAVNQYQLVSAASLKEIFGPPDDGTLSDADIFVQLTYARFVFGSKFEKHVPEELYNYRAFARHAKVCLRMCPNGCNVRGCNPRLMDMITEYSHKAARSRDSVYHTWYISRCIEQGLIKNYNFVSTKDKEYSLGFVKLILKYFINVSCAKSVEKAKWYAQYIFLDTDYEFLKPKYIELVDEIGATIDKPLDVVTENVTCSICLTDNIQRAANPDGCKHVFCYKCIHDYTDFTINQNTRKRRRCPLCRSSYFCLNEVNIKTLEVINCEFKI